MLRISFIILVFFFPFGSSFIFEKTVAPLSGLGQLVEAQNDRRVSVGMDIGKPGDTSRLAIKGIVFDLTKNVPSSENDFVKMPGVHGSMPSLSGGLHSLSIVQDGSFISMEGNKVVKTFKGCWEIVWRDGDPAESLLCGFEIDQDYKRNDATLPKGKIYISFSAWTSEGLKKAQNNKERSMMRANTALKRKDEELAKMAETNNLLRKALHYRNAVSATEEYYMEPNTRMKSIPSSEETVHFEGDLFVNTKGQVWTNDLPFGKHVILGTASLESAKKEV